MPFGCYGFFVPISQTTLFSLNPAHRNHLIQVRDRKEQFLVYLVDWYVIRNRLFHQP